MKKLLTNLSLFMALSIGLINPESIKANTNLAQCFKNQTRFNILAHAEMEQFDYYLIEIESTQTNINRNVVKIDTLGNCYTVIKEKEIDNYPLSNFLGERVAHNLLVSKYQTLIQNLGGKEAFMNALINELDAGVPHPFFYDEVKAMKQLGIDLEKEDSFLVIVGKEGISAHPELQFQE